MPTSGDEDGRQESPEDQRNQQNSPVKYPCWDEDLGDQVMDMKYGTGKMWRRWRDCDGFTWPLEICAFYFKMFARNKAGRPEVICCSLLLFWV